MKREAHLWRYNFYGSERVRLYIPAPDSDENNLLIFDALPDERAENRIIDVMEGKAAKYNMDKIRNGQDHAMHGTLSGKDYEGRVDVSDFDFDMLMHLAERHKANIESERETRNLMLNVLDSLKRYPEEV
jgi:hypothetical protein